MKEKHIVFSGVLILFITLVTFGFMEIYLRYFYTPNLGTRAFSSYQDTFWKMRFMHQHREGNKDLTVYQGINTPHPRRGWTPKPNVRRLIGGMKTSTNSSGHRGNHKYSPDKFTILIIGDSFSFGVWADDDDVWPTILQQSDKQINVINLSVGGYGIDQMYLTLIENIEKYKPQLVILPYICDDLYRSMLSFRDYRKPKFVLQGQKLVLTNTPIGNIDETIRHINLKYKYTLLSIKLIEDLYRKITFSFDNVFLLNERIIEEAVRMSQEHESDFLLVSLAHSQRLIDQNISDCGENFMSRFIKRHKVMHLNTRKHFLATGRKDWIIGHYKGKEANLVAQVVHDKIKTMASFKNFVNRSSITK